MLRIGEQPFLLMSQGDMAWSRGPKQEQAIIAAMRSMAGCASKSAAQAAAGSSIATASTGHRWRSMPLRHARQHW